MNKVFSFSYRVDHPETRDDISLYIAVYGDRHYVDIEIEDMFNENTQEFVSKNDPDFLELNEIYRKEIIEYVIGNYNSLLNEYIENLKEVYRDEDR